MRIVSAIALGLAIAPVAAAQAQSVTIGGVAITQADIVDARALPQLSGHPVIQITLEGAAASKLMTRRAAPGAVAMGNTIICPSAPIALSADGVLVLDCFAGKSIEEVAAIAKLVSGKDPLPDSLEDAL